MLEVAAAVGVALSGEQTIAYIGGLARPCRQRAGQAPRRARPGSAQARRGRRAGGIDVVREAVRDGMLQAAHDVSDGGLACALAECAIAGGVGVEVDLSALSALHGGEPEAWLFGEAPAGFVIAGSAEAVAAVADTGGGAIIGRAAGSELRIKAGEVAILTSLANADAAWNSLAERM